MNLIIDRAGTLFVLDGTLCFRDMDKKVEYYPIKQISNLFIYDEVNITFAVFRLLSEYRINLFMIDKFKKESLAMLVNQQYQGITNLHQAEYYLNSEKRLFIAKRMIKAEIHNLSYSLMKYRDTPRQTDFYSACIKEINDCSSVMELMAIEAQCMKMYYYQLSDLLMNREIVFHKRVARHAKDTINQMISYLNGILYNEILSLILECRLNPSISYVHSSNDRGNSLMLDIADIYKPIFTGKTILTLINRKELDLDEVKESEDSLPKQVRMKLIKQFHVKLHQTIQKEERNLSYETIIKEDLYSLRNYVNGKSKSLNFFELT